MSDEVRIALVAEGPTDRVVIEAAVENILGSRPFVLRQIQPEQSEAFGQMGTGWVGVYRWCKQAAKRAGGRLRDDQLLREYHLLVLHLDADVAEKSYGDGGITGEPPNLPCAIACPPPSATTNPLRLVLLGWCGETATPCRVVLCTPSKATEAWVIAAIFPGDAAMANVECYPNPEIRLAVQPVPQRIRKRRRDYESKRTAFREAWSTLATTLSEAQRFDGEFRAELARL
jgi:hypothetical protein